MPGVALGVGRRAASAKPSRKDLLVIRLADGAQVAGVFTQNRFCAAPVLVAREHLEPSQRSIRALVVNTGNANAGTGERGLAARAPDLRRGSRACSASHPSRCCRFPPA